MDKSEKCRIGIVDLMSFFWTLAGARKKGEPAFGLALQVLRYMRTALTENTRGVAGKLDAIAFCADGPGPSWRTAVDPAYKAHREEKPADRREELAALMAAMRGSGMCVIEEPALIVINDRLWFEGDDLCASIVAKALEGGDLPVVFSNDGDLAQLLALPGVELYSTRGEAITAERVFREWGVMPAKLGDLKALAGDSGDGYKPFPGSLVGAAKGIGEKGAVDLIKAFGGSQAAMNKALSTDGSGPAPARLMSILRAGGQAALDRGLKLALLRSDAPVPDGIAEVTSEDWDAAEAALKKREDEQRQAARLEDDRDPASDRGDSVGRPRRSIPREGADHNPDDHGGTPHDDEPDLLAQHLDADSDRAQEKWGIEEKRAYAKRCNDLTAIREGLVVADDGEGPILLTADEYWALAVLPSAMGWLKIPAEPFGALNALSFALCGLFEPVADGSAFLCARASKAARDGVSLVADLCRSGSIFDGEPPPWRVPLLDQLDRIPGALEALRNYGKPLARCDK